MYNEYDSIAVVFFNENLKYFKNKEYHYLISRHLRDKLNIGDIFKTSDNAYIKIIDKHHDTSKLASKIIILENAYVLENGKFNIKKENKMNNSVTNNLKNSFKNMANNFYCEVPNILFNSQFRMGIKNSNNEILVMNQDVSNGEFYLTTASFELFEMEIPAFAVATPVTNLAIGDIVVTNGRAIGWVVELNIVKGHYRYMTTSGTISNWTKPILNTTFNSKNVMVVKSMIGMDGGIGVNMQSMMPMILMSQMRENNGGGKSDIFETMMMMQMMGGMNPMMGGMFNQQPQQQFQQIQQPVKRTRKTTAKKAETSEDSVETL